MIETLNDEATNSTDTEEPTTPQQQGKKKRVSEQEDEIETINSNIPPAKKNNFLPVLNHKKKEWELTSESADFLQD